VTVPAPAADSCAVRPKVGSSHAGLFEPIAGSSDASPMAAADRPDSSRGGGKWSGARKDASAWLRWGPPGRPQKRARQRRGA
jgi:hypothetical protein